MTATEYPWGTKLWDQTANLLKYEDTGIALHERLQKFLLDFAKLQSDSFIAQRKLCEKYLINVTKVVGLETTYGAAFNEFVRTIVQLVDAENIMAVAFELQANGDIRQTLEEERKQLKQWKSDRDRFQGEMKSQIKIIDDEIKRYRDKYKEMLRAKDDFERIYADKSHSQLNVEKAMTAYETKKNDFERARSDYAAALKQFNLYRQQHYSYTLPVWGEAGHALDALRVERTQHMMNVLAERLRVAIDRMGVVGTSIEKAAASVDSVKDSELLVQRLLTGNKPPSDVVFVDMAQENGNLMSGVIDPGECHYASSLVPGMSALQLNVADADGEYRVASMHGEDSGGTASSEYAPNPGVLLGAARKLSNTNLGGAGGPAFLRRMFSRRSRTVGPIKTTSNDYGRRDSATAKLSDVAYNVTVPLRSTTLSVQPLEQNATVRNTFGSSDFSDTSFESAEDKLTTIEPTPPTNQLTVLPTEADVECEVPPLSDREDIPPPEAYTTNNQPVDVPGTDEVMASSINTAPIPIDSPEADAAIISLQPPPCPQNNIPSSSITQDLEPSSTPPVTIVNQAVETRLSVSAASTKPARPPPPVKTIRVVENGTSMWEPSPIPVLRNRAVSSPTATRANFVSSSRTAQALESVLSAASNNTGRDVRPNHGMGVIVGAAPSVRPTARSQVATARTPMTVAQPGSRSLHQPKRQAEGLRNYQASSPLRHENSDPAVAIVGVCTALYDFDGNGLGPSYLPFREGEQFHILASNADGFSTVEVDGWYYVQCQSSERTLGFVPVSYMKPRLFPEPSPLSPPTASNSNGRSPPTQTAREANTRARHRNPGDYRRATPLAYQVSPSSSRRLPGRAMDRGLVSMGHGTDL